MLTTAGRDNAVIMKCSKCGAEFDLSDYTFDSPVATIMREMELCHHCAYWIEMLEYPEQPYEIIDGDVWVYGQPIYYTDNANLTLPAFVMKKDKSIAKLPYPNCIGPLPDDFREQYPDTARFIDRQSYKRIKSRAGIECRAVGCYDRYNCFWYDPKLREPYGPWNEIPKYHKVGGENCPSFVNINTMFIKQK